MTTWQIAGKQRYRVVEDTVYWETQGDVSADDVHGITDVITEVHRQQGAAFVICDSTHPSHFTLEARQAMRERYEAGTAIAAPSIVVGGGAMQRVLLSLVLRALRLIGAKPPPVEFVATMADANEWLARQRKSKKPSENASPDR